ncbi:fabZ [Scenedesmus sp. PABB004]|nr:fabZ [Scenedesmus sp. PABB004]
MEADAAHQLQAVRAQLAQREAEVVALREIADAAGELQSADVQAAKVIELSKKNRALNLSLEKERHKVAKLQQALSEAAAATGAKEGGARREAGEGDGGEARELAAARQQLQQMTNKQGQMEAKVFLLEGEVRKLTRALSREVGDDVPLAKVVDEGSDWKGRRETIVHLRDTVRQLRDALAAAGGAPTTGAGPGGGGGGGGVAGSLAKHESAHRSVIGRLNKERGAEMERMAAELEAAQRAAEALRLQATGASSRRKVLEAEVCVLKEKLAVVLGKTQNDDRLIAALRAELTAGGRGPRSSPGAGGAAHELHELRARCAELEEQVAQQQKIIKWLQAQSAGGGAAPGTASALRAQGDGARLRGAGAAAARAPDAPLIAHLTEEQYLVLDAARHALDEDGGSEPMALMQHSTPASGRAASRAPFGAARPALGRVVRRGSSVVVRAEGEAAPAGLEKSMSAFKPVLDIEAIKGVLPHRYPFLLVDRVVEIEYGKHAVGYKNITVNDQFFNGHFPERAIMPGVLQIEAMAQLGGLVMLDPKDQDAKEQFFFGGIEGCRFRRPVVPGDTLMMRVEVTKFNKRFGIVKMAAKGYVGPDLAVEAELTLAMGKAS